MPIELRLLRCAISLVEHANFMRAARACKLSQPSLSRNIKDLEGRVGAQLFERAKGGVVPTNAGRIFLEHAREVMARSTDLDREMDLLRGLESGELRIGAGTYPATSIVDQSISQLVRELPKTRLHVRVDNWANLIALIKKREVDLAIIVTDALGDEPELEVTRVNRHQGYFVVRGGHPLVSAKLPLTLQDVVQFPTVMGSRLPTVLLKRFLASLYGDKPTPSIMKSFPTIACDSVEMMKTIVLGSDAVALLPVTPVAEEVRSGLMRLLPFVEAAFYAQFAVVRLAHRTLSPLEETFIRVLKEVDASVCELEQSAAATAFATATRNRGKTGRAARAPKSAGVGMRNPVAPRGP